MNDTSTYDAELAELQIWRFHCYKKAEKLKNFTEGPGLSEREIADHEIFLEYIKRLGVLNDKHGIEKQEPEICFGQLSILPPLEQVLDRMVI